jgi:hypothetical protein
MFSLQIFTELLIVGLFLILGIAPLLLLVNERAGGRSEFWPLSDSYSSKIKIVIVLILAYAAGAAGNRLVDDFWEDLIKIGTEKGYEARLQADLKLQPDLKPSPQPDGKQPRIICQGFIAEKGDCLKVAQMVLRERNEATRDWLDNRRAYIRLMRAASISAILFVLSLGVYKLKKRDSERFKLSHLAVAVIFMVLLTVGHWTADYKYWKRVYELYMAMPPPVLEVNGHPA